MNTILDRLALTPDHSTAASRADLTRTFAEATTLDLAVSPMIVAAVPGIGASTQLHALAEAHHMAHLEFRLDQMTLQDLPVLRNGEVVDTGPVPRDLLRIITGTRPALVIADFNHDIPDRLVKFIAAIVEHATTETVVALRTTVGRDEHTGRDRVEAAYQAIAEGLDIHRAVVPACIMDLGRSPRRIRLIGQITGTISNRGERHCEMLCSEPYEHEVRLTINAEDDQSDDAFADAVDGACDAGLVAVLATVDGDGLNCRAEDISILEARA
jgi:hypothetical protein